MTALTSFLDDPVLVLNRGYAATRVVPVRQAFVLLFRRAAEVISVIDGRWEQFDVSSWLEVAELQRRYEAGDHDWIRTASSMVTSGPLPIPGQGVRSLASSQDAGDSRFSFQNGHVRHC